MKKSRQGVVVSNKMKKTVVVKVERRLRHAFYEKTVRSFKNFKAHDENNQCSIGDVVELIETRPLSKGKCWRVVRIVGKKEVKLSDLPKNRGREGK